MPSEVIGVLLCVAMTVGLFATITFTLSFPATADDQGCEGRGRVQFTIERCELNVCKTPHAEVFTKCQTYLEQIRQEEQSVSNELPCRLAKYDLRYCTNYNPEEEPDEEHETDNLTRAEASGLLL